MNRRPLSIRRQLFLPRSACITRYFAYQRPSRTGEDLRVARRPLGVTGSPSTHRGHLCFLAKRIYIVEVVAAACQPTRTEDVLTSTRRSPEVLFVFVLVDELRGEATVRGYCRMNLRCTRRDCCFEDEKRIPRSTPNTSIPPCYNIWRDLEDSLDEKQTVVIQRWNLNSRRLALMICSVTYTDTNI